MRLPPSGRQVELACGEQRVTVTEVGATLRSYSVGGVPVLHGFGVHEMCPGGAGQLLAPWPNRVDRGSYSFAGTSHQLPLTEPVLRNAIHGLVRWSPWMITDFSARAATLSHRLHPQPGYPFLLDLDVDVGLSEAGLRISTSATNVGSSDAPVGVGWHPYVDAGGGTVDDLVVAVPAGIVIDRDDRYIPTQELAVGGTEHDFRAPRRVGEARLDRCYRGLTRRADGSAVVSVWVGERRVDVWMDDQHDFVLVYTGDTLDEARRRRGLAVEPMTCSPNAFRTGSGLRVLRPGERWRTTWGITTT